MAVLIPDPAAERAFAVDLARAFAGALIFGVPLLMTMEMWRFGFIMPPARQLAFLLAGLPLLYGLSVYAGFSRHRGVAADLMDTLAALAVGFLTAGAVLWLFGVLTPGEGLSVMVGQTLLLALPCAIGALVARRQLDQDRPDESDPPHYPGELFLMVAGALFLALNIAPTEEIVQIAAQMDPARTLLLALVSIGLLHALVYAIGFAGQEAAASPAEGFAHYTLPGYALCLLTGLFCLWLFGRTDGLAAGEQVALAVVLGFPASLGAAVARLLV
jgi:putative integral membrane protein (TIGR02587 family)